MDIRESIRENYPEIGSAPSTVIFPIHWGEMDAAQHVNNIRYLRWAETARIEFFKEIGMDTSFSNSVGPILGWIDAKYIRPVTYPDTILITTEVKEIQSDRLVLISKIYSENQKHVVAISHQEIIPYHYAQLKKVAIPDTWIEGIRRIQSDILT